LFWDAIGIAVDGPAHTLGACFTTTVKFADADTVWEFTAVNRVAASSKTTSDILAGTTSGATIQDVITILIHTFGSVRRAAVLPWNLRIFVTTIRMPSYRKSTTHSAGLIFCTAYIRFTAMADFPIILLLLCTVSIAGFLFFGRAFCDSDLFPKNGSVNVVT
tara:strand:+ start:52 stop:537 length:486 start_codon:yes stop_codon:yes gene_type:complete